jgi:hypothetical protein
LIPSDSGTGLAVETNEPTEEQEGSNNDEEVQRVQAVRSNVPVSRSSGRLAIKSTLPQAWGEDILGANKPSRRRTYKPKTSKEERARMKNAKAEEALALQQQKKEKKLEDAVNKEKKTAERFKEEAKERGIICPHYLGEGGGNSQRRTATPRHRNCANEEGVILNYCSPLINFSIDHRPLKAVVEKPSTLQ